MLVLDAFGIDQSSIRIQSESFLGSFARLQAGTVDVFILTGQPSDRWPAPSPIVPASCRSSANPSTDCAISIRFCDRR